MATNESSYSRPNGFLKFLLCAFLMVFLCVFILVNWNSITALLPAKTPSLIFATETAGPAAQDKPRPTTPVYQPRRDPLPAQNPGGTYNSPNAADAAFATAVAAGEQRAAPLPNVGQGAPAEVYEKPAERQPAGDNVPTAEPLPQLAADDQTGEKRVPVNIQETHQCNHGQVWVDGKGCKNP